MVGHVFTVHNAEKEDIWLFLGVLGRQMFWLKRRTCSPKGRRTVTLHKVNFAKLDILSSADDSARLLVLESFFIQKYMPLLNVDSKSAPLYLLN